MIFFLMLRFLSSRMQTLAPLTHSGSGEDTGGSSVPFLEGLKVWPRFNNIKHLSPLQLEDRGESTASVTSLLLWEESILCRVKLFPNTLKFFQKKPHIVFILHNQNIFSIVLNGLCGPVEGSSDQHLLVHYCKLVVHVTQVLIMSNLNTLHPPTPLESIPIRITFRVRSSCQKRSEQTSFVGVSLSLSSHFYPALDAPVNMPGQELHPTLQGQGPSLPCGAGRSASR